MTVYQITEQDMRGLSVRLAMLQTHYRKPKDFSVAELNAAAKTLRRWLAAAIPCDRSPPIEFMLAMCDDLNTPAAIAVMHRLFATKKGMDLFACLKIIGLIPGHGRAIDYDFGEVKTLPIDHIPLVQWAGFATLPGKQ